MRGHAVIAAIASVPLVVLSLVAVPGAENYRYSFAFLLPLLWGVYFLRAQLHLHPFHYALYAAGLVLHDLGALGCYRREYLGLAFDTYVHFYFGLAGTLLIERFLREGALWRGWRAGGFALLALLGIGAIHELVEFASTLALGDEVGMYKLGNPDEFDTQKDLLNNLLGGLVALGSTWAWRALRAQRRRD